MKHKDSAEGDIILVERAMSGDKSAFKELWKQYHGRLEIIAHHLCRDHSVSKDLVQESCVRAYLGLSSLRNPRLFGSWLIGIVMNVYREWTRDKNNQFCSLDSLAAMTGGYQFEESMAEVRHDSNPANALESKELRRILIESVMELPSRLRESALLYYFDGLSIREIAVLLKVSPQALKTRLSRARDSLRGKLRTRGVAEARGGT